MRWYVLSKIVLMVMLANISMSVFSSEVKCPQSKKGFVIGEATPDFIKMCLGAPNSVSNKSSLMFLYDIDSKTETALVYIFNGSGKLKDIVLRSRKVSSKEAEEVLAIKEGDAVAIKNSEARQEQARLASEREINARYKREAALSAQAMYLQAGKYDRNDQQSDAVRLYELLIEKFPSSPLAVQATNRLVAIQADEKASNSSKPSNTECSHLYIGKAVSYKGCGALWCTTVEGVITGIGNGVATMRVTGSEYNGDVIEKSCSKF